MKTLINLFKLLLIIILSASSYGGAKYSCNGEKVSNIHNAVSDGYKEYITGVDVDETARYFKFRTKVDGTITIRQKNNKPQSGYWNHQLYIGTSCDSKDIYRGPGSSDDSKTFTVEKNQYYYIKVKEFNSKNTLNFDISFDFKASLIETCPGNTIPALDGTGASATDSFNGVTVYGNSTYYYHFTPTVAGTIQTNSSVNGGKYSNSLFIKDGCGADLWSDQDNSITKSSPDIAVAANQTIVIAFERRYKTNLTLDIDFTYTVSVPTPPVFSTIPDQSASMVGTFTLDTSTFVTELDGDNINYIATGLPNGLAVDGVTGIISGTPTTVGTYSVTVTANDKDGSDSDNFTIAVIAPPVADAGADQNILSGATLTLNGSGSTGTNLSYVWKDGGTTLSTNSSFNKNDFSVGTHTITLTVTDSSGTISSDNVVITIIKPCHGCDCTLDDNNINNSLPGNIITALNGATGDVNTCLSGDNMNGDPSDYYYFTVNTPGILNITTSSPNNHKYHLKIGSSPNGSQYYYDHTAQSHNVSAIKLQAGDTVYIYVNETGSDLDEYEINFDFKQYFLETCPGDVIPNLEGTAISTTDSFTNVTVLGSATYYYYFTPTEAGTIQTNSSVNAGKYSNSLFIKDGCGADLWSNQANSEYKSSPEIAVAANQTIVIAFERRYSTNLNLNIDFTYTVIVPTPPIISPIPDQSIQVGIPFTLDISPYVTEADGDDINYTITNPSGLPAGLTLDRVTGIISGTPTTVGTYSVTVTANDKDGSDSDSFTIEVIAPPVADAGADQNVLSGATLTLNGSGSTGTNLSYVWKDGGTTLSTNSSFNKNDFSVGTHTITLTVTDSSGATSSDDVVITITKACHGCDCSLDDDNINHSIPGKIITALNGATSDVNTCFSGDSNNGDPADYYYFTVNMSGNLNITTSSPNGHSYHLKIGSSPNGSQYYTDHTAQSHSVPTIKLNAGDKVYIYLKETGSNLDEYEVNLDFAEYLTETCPGDKIPALDGTGASATDSFTNVTVLGSATYYYHFTPTIAGTIQTNSSVNGGKYANSLFIKDGCGADLWSDQTDSVTKSSPEIAVAANQTIVIAFERRWTTTLNLDIDFTYTVSVPTPPVMSPIPDQLAQVGTPFTLDISSFVTEADGDDINYTITNPSGLPAGLALDRVTGIISGTPTSVGVYSVTVTANDKDGADSDSFIIDITIPQLNAVADIYDVSAGVVVTGNLLTNDSGLYITVTGNTPPSNGTVTIAPDGGFSYTPIGTLSTDSFTYTITDSTGQSATATVTINISTIYSNGIQDFVLINPPETRNIIGGYTILGNTSECITNSKTTYTGTCQGSDAYNDNNYMAKYIDIDGNTGIGAATWNSSSSNFTLPTNYDQLHGKGILWAGLFWQGSINNKLSKPQRRAYVDGDSYLFENITSNSSINLENTDGNRLLIRVDNDPSYTPLQATTFYYDTAHGSNGGYYAAYTDITSLIQSKNLASGKHTVTVANLTANEGRQSGTGNYGGWSMVVIYKQDDLTGDATNVSIYSGYTTIPSTQEVTISGFRLPSAGDVHAKFSTFAGEGEEIYGGSNSSYDRMVMKRLSGDTGDQMPGATNSNNIFDAILANIDRDPGNNNDMRNTNGIDVDSYDVSSIITKYRDLDKYIGTIYIGLSSNSDYITPSMMAFSTALYQPNICYDYTIDIGGFIIPSKDNKIKTNLGSYGAPLTTKVSILSKEGDFALDNVSISYRVDDTQQLNYITNSTGLAPNERRSYEPAGPLGLNQTYGENPTGFDMYIGDNAGNAPDGPGGVIDSYQARYLTFDTQMVQSSVDTSFKLWIEYTVDYGSGPIHLSKGFGESSLCPPGGGYYPAWGIFNVSSDQASIATGQPYNLYTQIVNRAFNARLFSYNSNFTSPKIANSTVEVEVYNAGILHRDTNVSCFNPDSNISAPIFIKFNNATSAPITGLQYDLAIQNAGFRTWFLEAIDGRFIEQNCINRNDESCFRTIYQNDYPTDTNCVNECSGSGTNCYACLRKFYGRILCSRDNFSIRPETFFTQLKDTNQNSSIFAPNNIDIANSLTTVNSTTAPVALAADYNYTIQTRATDYRTNTPVRGYVQDFNINANTISVLKWNPRTAQNVIGCVDINDSNITMSIFNGTNISDNIYSVTNKNQVGRYKLSIVDSNWTSADWDSASLNHHNPNRGFSTTPDCTIGSGLVQPEGQAGLHGCEINSTHAHPNNQLYNDLDLEFYPYSFNVNSLSRGAGPSQRANNNALIYINTLSTPLYPNGVDENMSYNIFGALFATGYRGNRLTNFVNGCYAQNIDLTTNYQYLSTVPASTNTPALTYDFDDGINTRVQGTLTPVSAINTNTPILINLTSSSFDTNATMTMDLGFNFNRIIDTPLNPRLINFIDFNVTFNVQPNLNVDLIANYQIFGDRDINQSASFFYAKVKPAKKFYEDVTGAEMLTPLSVVNFCDQNITECQFRGIDVITGQTDETNWWLSTNHSTLQNDGSISLAIGTITEGTGSTPNINPSNALIQVGNNGGRDLSIIVNRGANPVLPLTVPINLVTDPTALNFTNRWLVYDQFAFTDPSSLLYRVRFLGNSTWGGFGERGNVVGTNASEQKTKRLDW